MAEKNYIYAVARIRTKELSLLTASYLEQLLGAKSYQECLQLLIDKGWGDGTDNSPEHILAVERQKTWDLIADMVDDMSPFDVFLYANDYHNLKAAIKAVYTNDKRQDIYIKSGTIDPALIYKAVAEKNYDLLPEHMQAIAKEGLDTLLHTRDGQLLDVIVDKAALDAIYAAGSAAKNPIIALYGELTVATADLKVAVRASKTGKDRKFLDRALAECKTLDLAKLKDAATEGFDAICDYIENTKYSDGVEELRKSMSAFERWGDNLLIRAIQPEIRHPFTIGPLAAYILARENEIKTVRIVLSGKINDLPDDSIRERVREMYV